ncbi:amino acid adenylation domain-containing protein [Numidum massiliense]|uniref:amino acid adenylation domain-containing protein n=1 Tax=Numidum massiliense TaxID=1522315 RepID=UPI0006D57A7F|nr:amino acid adenylation domain-containing protein [Numidum massiliense]
MAHIRSSRPLAIRTSSTLLHAGFLSSVERYPDALALTIANREWTYAEIDDIARRWAFVIRNSMHAAPRRIGIFAYRSEVSYIGVLASLFSGAAFVPLNRTFPTQRTRAMIEQAELDALIVDKASLPQFYEIVKDLRRLPYCILLPDSHKEDFPHVAVEIRDRLDVEYAVPVEGLPVISSEAMAYLLFTSGSTGVPKGVPITHSNVSHFISINQQRYQITPEDRLTQTFDQTFDLSVFDLFMAWGGGAAVCVIQPIELLSPFRYVRDKGITVWFSVPSVAALLRKQNLLKPNSLSSLRLSLFCGEALPRATAEAWQVAAPHSVIENLYGPTELTIACTAYRWHPIESPKECVNDIVPIGQLYPGLDACLLDENLEPVPRGSEGELCVAGPQTFPGYWRNPEQTKQRTVRIKQASGEVKEYYRTGDRVRYLSSGNLAYMGRIDHQVQIQGYRIELSEIEGVLSQQHGVFSAVALSWPVENGTAKGIVAFVIASPEVNATTLIEAAREKVPNYMVPRSIYIVEDMPLNANGKVDRKELLRRLEAGEIQG